ncbi:DtxR family iron (metal) dependent repressor [Luteococcus japonicus]|uniref:DtxR family iron (Metal) dependent repressor n=1 Tax=Luteococcus japonicus TaxID=33984 RepID=A0A3N1ZTN5_9ACTN|nr:metal-dependent transcriptional regulator [Luteococcus japonicus]ROR54223.1 DtxR family iron (metal) dependent repressor [Luteococcus japonicus]
MNELIDTTEMYLRTIYELMEEGITPLRARIAERLHQSGPTVSQTVARMERDGLLRVHEDRRIELSDKGRGLAIAVMRKHRLAERLLVDVIGLEWSQVHDEACRWEHVISDEVERRLVQILSDPVESPYGNPIPGLDAIGGAGSELSFREGVESLTTVLGAEPVQVVLRRMSENCQADPDTLGVLQSMDLLPGTSMTARLQGQTVVIEAGGRTCEVPAAVAEGLFVSLATDA